MLEWGNTGKQINGKLLGHPCQHDASPSALLSLSYHRFVHWWGFYSSSSRSGWRGSSSQNRTGSFLFCQAFVQGVTELGSHIFIICFCPSILSRPPVGQLIDVYKLSSETKATTLALSIWHVGLTKHEWSGNRAKGEELHWWHPGLDCTIFEGCLPSWKTFSGFLCLSALFYVAWCSAQLSH